MELIEERQITHDGQIFTLRLFRTADGWSVYGFLNNRAVTLGYTVSDETHTDYYRENRSNAFDLLFDTMTADIKNGRRLP